MKKIVLRCAKSAFDVLEYDAATGVALLRTHRHPVTEVRMKIDVAALKQNGFTLTQEEDHAEPAGI